MHVQSFNVDRIIRKKDYDNIGEQLLVTSYFRTIQGEGPFAGYPSVFLRLAGCNFGNKSADSACHFCDTNFKFDEGTRWDADKLLHQLIKGLGSNPSDVLVITGGEPTLQHNLLRLLELAEHEFRAIQIETNGTQASFFQALGETSISKAWHANQPGVYTVVSPKAVYKAGVIPETSATVLAYTGCLKFVLSADKEDAHHEVPEWAIKWTRLTGRPVYVSPMAVYKRAYCGEVSSIWDDDLIDRERTAANYSYAANYAMKHNLLLSLQTHLFTAVP